MKYKLYLFLFSLVIFAGSAHAQSLQKIYTYAGNGYGGYGGDGGNASGASLWGPVDVVLDASGSVYVSDFLNNRVRKINAGGLITTIAGTGAAGSSGNGSIGTSALIVPRGLAIAPNGDLYISSAASHVIRKINSSGIISAVAGTGASGYTGDGGQASLASLNSPSGIAFDKNGNLFIADQGNNVIRKINTAGIITTVAGNGVNGNTGNGGLATLASLDSPYSVVFDHLGNMFINDYGNNMIRMVDAANMISTYAGAGAHGYTGDGGAAIAATLNNPRGMAVDTGNNLYIADADNNVVRKVSTAGIITTVAGNGTYGFGGDLGFALGANLFNPYAVAVDIHGNIYIADANNERIRKTYSANVGVNPVNAASAIIDVYPNPFCNAVTISGLTATDRISIYDVTGRLAGCLTEAGSSAPQTINTGNIKAGVYFLKVTDAAGNTKSTVRLVKD